MKKISFITLMSAMLLVSVDTIAQTIFGLRGSFNMYNMTIKDIDGKKVESTMVPAMDAGVFAEIPVADEFFFRPELLFATKGAKSKNQDPNGTIHLSYLELPLNFLYKGDLSGGKIFLGIGPYLAMGIGGKVSSGGENIDVKFKNDVSSAEDNAWYYKPIDFGGNLMAGYEFSWGLSVAINASLGMSNIEPKYDGKQYDSSKKNNGFGLTLAYRFKK